MKRIHSLWVAYTVGILVILLTARLGIWQWDRAEEKSLRMIQWSKAEKYPPMAWEGGALPGNYRHLILTGEWLLPQQILLDNRVEEGRPGFHVITPFIIDTTEGTRIIAVNRGWIAKPAQGLPVVPTPTTQTIIVRGEPVPRFFELQNDARRGVVWQNLDWPEYQNKLGGKHAILYTVAVNDLGDGLQRNWPTPDSGRERNQAYALQWFSLSILLGCIMLYLTGRQYWRKRHYKDRSDV